MAIESHVLQLSQVVARFIRLPKVWSLDVRRKGKNLQQDSTGDIWSGGGIVR